jgi:5-methylcytosine-specific restriction endonuclease McrA
VSRFRSAKPDSVAQHRANANHKRRARLVQGEFENVDIDALYERDGGVCQICMTEVPRGLATIDHIIPLSRGGGHTYDNTQIAHRVCNSKKGARIG